LLKVFEKQDIIKINSCKAITHLDADSNDLSQALKIDYQGEDNISDTNIKKEEKELEKS
jgi:hypothetical protein